MPGRYPAKVKLIGRVFAFVRHFFSSILERSVSFKVQIIVNRGLTLVLILVGSKPHTNSISFWSQPNTNLFFKGDTAFEFHFIPGHMPIIRSCTGQVQT